MQPAEGLPTEPTHRAKIDDRFDFVIGDAHSANEVSVQKVTQVSSRDTSERFDVVVR